MSPDSLCIQAAPYSLPEPRTVNAFTEESDRTITPGRVKLKLPALAENGNSVRLTVSVDSPMTEADHVRFIQLFHLNKIFHI